MFDVPGIRFHRASDGTTVTGVCNAISESNREATIVFAVNGLNWTLPYREFFSVVTTAAGERPEFIPLDDGGNPYAFNDGERVWDPATDLGMTI